MVPDSPTVTNNPVVVELSVLVVLDVLLDEVQDMEMDASLVGAPDFKPARAALTLS